MAKKALLVSLVTFLQFQKVYWHQVWQILIHFIFTDSPYGENLTPEQAYHLQMAQGGFEEPQTPTQNYGQMSFEDAIDGGHNSGSYNAGQQQRRIIREIIV